MSLASDLLRKEAARLRLEAAGLEAAAAVLDRLEALNTVSGDSSLPGPIAPSSGADAGDRSPACGDCGAAPTPADDGDDDCNDGDACNDTAPAAASAPSPDAAPCIESVAGAEPATGRDTEPEIVVDVRRRADPATTTTTATAATRAPRRQWTAIDLERLRTFAPAMSCKGLAEKLGRSQGEVSRKARQLDVEFGARAGRGGRRRAPRPEPAPAPDPEPEPVRASAAVAAAVVQVETTRERRHGRRRTRTIAARRLSRAERAAGAELADVDTTRRPKTRAECVGGPRPCPWAGCRHHLYLDVNPETGSVRLNFPGVDLADMTETCALDVADRDGVTLDTVAAALNVTRERIRQIEALSLERLRTGERCRTMRPRT